MTAGDRDGIGSFCVILVSSKCQVILNRARLEPDLERVSTPYAGRWGPLQPHGERSPLKKGTAPPSNPTPLCCDQILIKKNGISQKTEVSEIGLQIIQWSWMTIEMYWTMVTWDHNPPACIHCHQRRLLWRKWLAGRSLQPSRWGNRRSVWLVESCQVKVFGGLNPSEKYESQLGWWNSQY